MLVNALAGIWRAGHAALAAVPSQCAVCHAWPAQRVCGACEARFAAPRHCCVRCAMPTPDGVSPCGECLRHPPAFDACLAAVDYGYPWAQVLGDFKFRADPGWAGPLAQLLAASPGASDALAAADLVVPVPLSNERLRERGFNQALLLARKLAPAKAPSGLLLRIKATSAQSGLPRVQRLRNLRGAFMVEPSLAHQVTGRRIVLLDDVMTTGATLQSAAEPLRQAGAAHITAMVVARTP